MRVEAILLAFAIGIFNAMLCYLLMNLIDSWRHVTCFQNPRNLREHLVLAWRDTVKINREMYGDARHHLETQKLKLRYWWWQRTMPKKEFSLCLNLETDFLDFPDYERELIHRRNLMHEMEDASPRELRRAWRELRRREKSQSKSNQQGEVA